MQLSHEILIESRYFRVDTLSSFTSLCILKVLNVIKPLRLVSYEDGLFGTTGQASSYYEVSERAINLLLSRNEEEFNGEMTNLSGKSLRENRELFGLPATTSRANIWAARGFLRMGLMLTESPVAKNLRDLVLDIAEGIVTYRDLIEDLDILLVKYSYKSQEIPKAKLNRERANFSATIHLSPREFSKLNALAQQIGISRSELVYRHIQHLF
ncbi:MAG: hypothetical protein PUP93_30465 [Rhizonema sp. NSF051]|nr:hypothetical protein [Rhizonema sp. NSF051]